MKRLLYISFVLFLFSCTDHTDELRTSILQLYNSKAENDFQATELVVVKKKGNEYLGLVTTKNGSKLLMSIFSDGNELFYWMINGNIQYGDVDLNVTENMTQEASMDNFPDELVGTWSDDCEALNSNLNGGLYMEVTYFSINENGEMEGGFQYETSSKIKGISGENGTYKVDYEETGFGPDNRIAKSSIIKVNGDRLEIDGYIFYRCN